MRVLRVNCKLQQFAARVRYQPDFFERKEQGASAELAVRMGIGFISANRYIAVFQKPHPMYIGIPECQTDKSDMI